MTILTLTLTLIHYYYVQILKAELSAVLEYLKKIEDGPHLVSRVPSTAAHARPNPQGLCLHVCVCVCGCVCLYVFVCVKMCVCEKLCLQWLRLCSFAIPRSTPFVWTSLFMIPILSTPQRCTSRWLYS